MTRREAARVGAAIERLRKAESDYLGDVRHDAVDLLNAIRDAADALEPVRERDADRWLARMGARPLPTRPGRCILPESSSANIR